MDYSILLSILITPFILAAISSFTFTPLIGYIYRLFGHLDDPKKNSHSKVVHTYPVPRGGGIPIFLSLLISMLVYLGLDKHSFGIVSGALILMIVGVVDDLKNLSPYWRLFWGILAASCVVASGIGIGFVTNPFGGVIDLSHFQISFQFLGQTKSIWVLADIFAILWILWSMNLVNWSKGLDGQLPGVVVIAAATIALLSFRFNHDVTQWDVSILAAITAGSYLGFLPWNMFPQKIMPGYGGGSIAGYLLAILSILSGAKLATMILVLGLPMIDAAYTILRRLAQGKSPVWGDRGHLHHRLMDIGWNKKKIALFYWVSTGLLGYIALQLNSQQKLFTILLLTLIIGGILLWLNYFIRSSKPSDHASG